MDAKRAMAEGRDNQFRRWGGKKRKTWPNEAASRIRAEGAIEIGHRPRFGIAGGCSVFTIGSCFARNIEAKLEARGFDVPATRFSPPPGVREGKRGPPNAVLNKFTVHSIGNELDRVLEGVVPKNRGFIADEDGLWFDPQASYAGALDWQTANRLRDAIEATSATVKDADVVFLTLGLTESWLDTETGVYLNGDLPRRQMLLHPGRFRYVNFGYAELVVELRRIIGMIRKHGKPDVKIIVTVSPVPLGVTFSGRDIIVANNYSKSVLLAVAQDVLAMDGVDYYPSYEMVMFSPRSFAWAADYRHPSVAVVEAVTDRFIDLYVGKEAAGAEAGAAGDRPSAAAVRAV